jgi:hypothetical protein
MFNRGLLAALLGVACLGELSSEVALYFGRCDTDAWSIAHPAPPPPAISPGKHRVELVESRRIVPSSGLPLGLEVKTANNNLDVVRHGGLTYLAFRSAPSHFAGSETALHVVRSADEQSWQWVASFAERRDLREPRWLALGERLFLYVSVLGDNPFDFVPRGVSLSELGKDGTFSPLRAIGLPGRVAWRTREIGGRGFMTAYRGGEHLYSLGREPMEVEFLTTEDGRNFRAVDPGHRVVSRGGGSEADFAFAADGSLLAVIRNEAGDDTGFGSKLCRAPRTELGNWTCRSDPKKYDSPNVFSQGGEVYVFGRRHLANEGRYDVASGPDVVRMIRNQLSYIVEAKRCALWRFDSLGQRLDYVLDLPSRGDTCFASVLPGATPDTLVVYDYSSDVDGPDLPWSAGQRLPTYIYRHVLRFAPL